MWLLSQVAEMFRVLACSIGECIKINDMNALYVTQMLDIYDVTEIHDFQGITVASLKGSFLHF